MTDEITSTRQIPDAPLYVLTDDKFMSGWGMAAGRINTLIFPCESYEVAIFVHDNAVGRGDQQRVRICSNKPRLRSGHLYQLKTRETYGKWYERGAFCRCK